MVWTQVVFGTFFVYLSASGQRLRWRGRRWRVDDVRRQCHSNKVSRFRKHVSSLFYFCASETAVTCLTRGGMTSPLLDWIFNVYCCHWFTPSLVLHWVARRASGVKICMGEWLCYLLCSPPPRVELKLTCLTLRIVDVVCHNAPPNCLQHTGTIQISLIDTDWVTVDQFSNLFVYAKP